MQISKALESLEAAELCYARKLYNSTANRAYYAMFQAAATALQTISLQPSGGEWSHARLQATFALELTRKRKTYPHSLAKTLVDGLWIRSQADYEDTSVSERRAAQVLKWAREFVQCVKQEVSHE